MNDYGDETPTSFTPIRLFTRFEGTDDGWYMDWWIPTMHFDAAMTLAKELDIEVEPQGTRDAPACYLCRMPFEPGFRKHAEQLKDPAYMAGQKKRFEEYAADKKNISAFSG